MSLLLLFQSRQAHERANKVKEERAKKAREAMVAAQERSTKERAEKRRTKERGAKERSAKVRHRERTTKSTQVNTAWSTHASRNPYQRAYFPSASAG